MTQVIGRKPTIKNGKPDWFHHYGDKVRFYGLNHVRSPEQELLLGASAVDVKIRRMPGTVDWLVEYEIRQEPGSKFNGSVRMSTEELQTAFSLSDDCSEQGGGQWLLDQYGGDVACQGKFIRWRANLNIPGPGTGHNGNPNVSIFFDDEIRRVVRDAILHTE